MQKSIYQTERAEVRRSAGPGRKEKEQHLAPCESAEPVRLKDAINALNKLK